MIAEFDYLHDGGPHKSHMKIISKEYKNGNYRLEIQTNDCTDFNRLVSIIPWIVRENHLSGLTLGAMMAEAGGSTAI